MSKKKETGVKSKAKTKKKVVNNDVKRQSLTSDMVSEIQYEYKQTDKNDSSDVRVGEYDDEMRYKNYKIRRYDYNDIPVMEISDLEGAWMIRIPYDSDTYQVANMLIDTKDDSELIEVFLTNLRTVSGIPNGYYQQGIMLLTMCYIDPSLLSGGLFLSKEQKQFRKDVKMLRGKFLEWYDEWKSWESRREEPGVYDDYYLHKSEDVLSSKNDDELKKNLEE